MPIELFGAVVGRSSPRFLGGSVELEFLKSYLKGDNQDAYG